MKLYPREIVSVALSESKSESDSSGWRKNNALQYFLTFLDFGYHLYYIPFRLVNKGGYYIIKSTVFHKAMCAIVHLLSAYRFSFSTFEVLSSYDSGHNPVLYFELGRTFMTTVYMLVFKWAFWTNQKLLASIVNDLVVLKPSEMMLACMKKPKINIKEIAIIICMVYTMPPIISVMVGSKVIHVASWEPIRLLESYAGATRNAFLLQSTREPLPLGNFNVGTYFIMILYVIMNFYYFLGGHYFDLSILIGALTLKHMAKQFSITVHNIGDPYFINKLLEEYTLLKELSTKINKAIGCVTFCFVMEAFPYYATHLDDILTLDDWYSRCRYIFYLLNFFSILVIASDIPLKVDVFRTWLNSRDNCLSLPCSKVVTLLNDLSTYPVGIKAGGVVTITYGFIGTMVSVVITYAVIIIQFNYTSTHNCTGSSS